MNIRSMQRLDKCHPDLRKVMLEAAKSCNLIFEISETLRTKQRQAELLKIGATTTLRSRHLAHVSDGLSRAADFYIMIDGKARWDWPLYNIVGNHIKAVAKALGIPIVWGGDWRRFKDGPHIELDRNTYP